MLRPIFASRVLLGIRAQTGEQPVRSDGLTGLNTDHLRAGNTQFIRVEEVQLSTINTSRL